MARTTAQLLHYRTKEHVEVDAIVEAAAGHLVGIEVRAVGIEVRAAETVHRRDFAGLRRLQSRLGDRFHLGLVAAPIDLLWQ